MDLSPKGPPPTLGEVARDCEEARVTCLDCRHEALVKLARLALAAAWDDPFPAVTARLKCSACGAKRVHVRPEWRLR